MKKIITTFMCICMMCMFAGCSTSNANPNAEAGKTATPLTYLGNFGTQAYTTNAVETEEGVFIFCTSNYILGPEAGGQFLYGISEWTEDCLEDDYDWKVRFISNGHIYQVDFFDYEGSLIGSEKCNGMATVDNEYGETGTYVGSVMLYIEYEGNLYTAEFICVGG